MHEKTRKKMIMMGNNSFRGCDTHRLVERRDDVHRGVVRLAATHFAPARRAVALLCTLGLSLTSLAGLAGCGGSSFSSLPAPAEPRYEIPDKQVGGVDTTAFFDSFDKLVEASENIVVGEVVKKKFFFDTDNGNNMYTDNSFTVIGNLKGKFRAHDEIIIVEDGSGSGAQYLKNHEVMLLFLRPESNKKNAEASKRQLVVGVLSGKYSLKNVNDFTTLISHDFSSPEVQRIEFARTYLYAPPLNKLPLRLTLRDVAEAIHHA